MNTYDNLTVETAAGAFREALYHLEGTRDGVPITQDAANLAIAIGVAASMARGETGRTSMVLSGLHHMAAAYLEHSEGIDTQNLPEVRTAEHYARHAEVLFAMADASKDDDCRAALDRCAKTFRATSRSKDLVGSSLRRLCQYADGG